jgi:hypothetical protein
MYTNVIHSKLCCGTSARLLSICILYIFPPKCPNLKSLEKELCVTGRGTLLQRSLKYNCTYSMIDKYRPVDFEPVIADRSWFIVALGFVCVDQEPLQKARVG